MYFKITIALVATSISSVAIAQIPTGTTPQPQASATDKTNSINISPLGVLVGSYSLNYERLFGGYHGLLIEGSFASSEDDEASSFAAGAGLGYRFHWRGQQNSGFIGGNLSVAAGLGEATIETGGMKTTFDVDTSLFAVTVNIGKRWVWDSGLNVTLRVGGGRGFYSVSTESKDPDAVKAVDAVDELLTSLPIAIDGELSVGYTY